jgi:hypothetical protein
MLLATILTVKPTGERFDVLSAFSEGMESPVLKAHLAAARHAATVREPAWVESEHGVVSFGPDAVVNERSVLCEVLASGHRVFWDFKRCAWMPLPWNERKELKKGREWLLA